MRVYHYLPSEFGLSNIALHRMKISLLSDLNDPFELLAVNTGGNPGLRSTVTSMKKTLGQDRGLLCFSKTWHNPVMWSHYASRHSGMCLGFELQDGLGRGIDYADKRFLAKIGDGQSFAATEAFAGKLLFTKYAHWHYEQEHRVFVSLDKDASANGLYFFDFKDGLSLKEVFLGPLCPLPVDQVRGLVSKIYGATVRVTKTRLAFKSFSVVEDRQFRVASSNKSLERSRDR